MTATEVKLPILLDSNLADSEILQPISGSLKLCMCGVSECSLKLPGSVEIAMHAWVKVFNRKGFVGIFRKSSDSRVFTNDGTITLKHGIDILQDSIWDEDTTFTGTKAQFLTALLDKQTALIQGPGDSAPRKPWVLGTCADTGGTSKDINYNDLLSLLQGMEDEGGDYYFSYDQSTWPWTVSFLARPTTAGSEFRIKRNMEKCSIAENDSELCTRLLLNVNYLADDATLGVQQTQSIYRTYNNTAAQALYGVIVKTYDIDTTGDDPDNNLWPESDAFAAKYLAERAAPINIVTIDGYELTKHTGTTWDESRIADLVRVSLPDYDTFISERCSQIQYSNLFGAPERVTVTLSNATAKNLRENESLVSSVSSAQSTARSSARSRRSSSREETNFKKHFQITDDNDKILKQAGMQLDADGLLVYADDEVNMVGARFNVQADKIGMVVGEKDGANFIKAAEICVAINDSGDSEAIIDADHVKIGTYGQSNVTINDVLTISSTGLLYAPSGMQVANGMEVVQNLYLSSSLGGAAPVNLRYSLYDIKVESSGRTRSLYKQTNDPTGSGWTLVATWQSAS